MSAYHQPMPEPVVVEVVAIEQLPSAPTPSAAPWCDGATEARARRGDGSTTYADIPIGRVIRLGVYADMTVAAQSPGP